MRRFLVVGCGGSGGKTLAYLMDQLRSDLSKDGVSELPSGWQFVFVDVPSGVDNGPEGLGSVVAQGGTYVGMGPKGGSYPDLDQTVSQKLRDARAFDGIATWAPRRPDRVATPINVGAGQYRAIGRMILLARAGEVRRELAAAMERINAPESTTSMSETARAVGTTFDVEQPTIVFVIGSMAGGSGASMALDVCRLLTQLSGVNEQLISLFMVSADVFDTLPPADRSGVRANALAMLGEIVASQAGAASRHDTALLTALGCNDGAGVPIPFARVFPVSRLMGVRRARFGDGTMGAVYRGLARGLAGLMISEVASQQFVDFDLGNSGSVTPNPRYLGWGAETKSIPWGSYGFASLSMGRDRYAEYAAQRIARSCADRLLDGHLQQGSLASGTEQVNALLDSLWQGTCDRLQLPTGRSTAQQASAELGNWITTVALPRAAGEGTARQIVDRDFAPHVPSPYGRQATQWRDVLGVQTASRRQMITESVGRAAYEWAFEWHLSLVQRTKDIVSDAISKLGLAYAGALVERLETHLADFVAPNAHVISRSTAPDLNTLPDEVNRTLSSMRGAIVGGDNLVARVIEGMRIKVRTLLYTRASELLGDGLLTFVNDVLKPMNAAIREAQTILEQARASQLRHDGLARLETTQYAAWPSDSDLRVPERFDEANNEVLLTTSKQFGAQYLADMQTAIPAEQASGSPRLAVTAQVTAGVWTTTGGLQPPGGLMKQTVGWRSRAFPTDPLNGESLVPSEARFNVHVRPSELLDRARKFVARPEESFHRFCSVSLRDYLIGTDVRESEREARYRDVVTKFRETLALAVPLISVDEQSVQILHGGNSVEYRYKFSSVPFRNLAIEGDLEKILTTDPNIDPSSVHNLKHAMTDQGNPRRIDIFGSYPLYSPLAFDSVLEPVAQEWEATTPQGRGAYWTYRRARTLDASLAMSDAERRAMVAGWYIGQLVGEIRIPEPPYASPVQIWDPEASAWVAFPHPLLTSPDRFRALYDWLPAVLESQLLAISRVQKPPVMSSLKPYLLLRELYDRQEFGPASGIVGISAADKLAIWIAKGSQSGTPSRIPAVAAAQTAEERRDTAKEWLVGAGGPGHLAATEFLPSPEGNGTRGSYAVIASRAQASETPFFRDLAQDIEWATQSLAAIVDQAFDTALRARSASESDEPANRPSLPEGGVF